MSTTSTTTTDTRTAQENTLWQTLTDNPGSTTSELANFASVPKTTVRKIVAAWAGEGLVVRANDGDDRSGFRWRIAADAETSSAAPEPTPQATADEPASAATQDVPAADATTTAEPHPTPDTDAAETQPADEPLPEESDTETDTTEAISPTPGSDADSTAGEEDSVDPAADPAVKGTCPTCGQRIKRPRGPQPGALRGLVEDFLRDHPGEEFTPGQIAKALGGKSSGAVYNACFALVGRFVAEYTCERPNKFKLHPTQEQQQAQEQAAQQQQ
ncbi:MarR family transcriptional regulator [Nocardia vulneris]|uniref:MarR family transcriptional regulator n=1 Tax=Nocardia vulneris TaxID=1141657 RepID=A0ABR4Z7V5_9NOCA|nr:helix-turn-helix domain-containing protein [Nocardia vulneris]KIA61129.1 hypothetical protein FG87_32935 [Nocardia vulneris]